MQDYNVSVLVDASVGITVTAETPEEAAEMAMCRDEASPGLCHYCAGEVDLGDPLGVIVSQDMTELYDNTLHGQTMLHNEILRENLAAARTVLAGLLDVVPDYEKDDATITAVDAARGLLGEPHDP